MSRTKFEIFMFGMIAGGLSFTGHSLVRANTGVIGGIGTQQLGQQAGTTMSAGAQISGPSVVTPVFAPRVASKAVLNTTPTAANQASALASSGVFDCPNCSAATQNSNVPLDLNGSTIQGLFNTTAALTFPQPSSQGSDACSDTSPSWMCTSTYQNYQQSLAMNRATFTSPFSDGSSFDMAAMCNFFNFQPIQDPDCSGPTISGLPTMNQLNQEATQSSPLFQAPQGIVTLPTGTLPIIKSDGSTAGLDSESFGKFLKVSSLCSHVSHRSKTNLA